MTTAIKLTTLRRERGLRQKQIAMIIGIKKATYAAYEESRCRVPHEIICGLCDFYGITVDSFRRLDQLVQ